METPKLKKSVATPTLSFRQHGPTLIALFAFVMTVNLYLSERFLNGNWEDTSDRWERFYDDAQRENDRLGQENAVLERQLGELRGQIDDLTPKKAASELTAALTVEAIGSTRAEDIFYGCLAEMSWRGPFWDDAQSGYRLYAVWNCEQAAAWSTMHPFDSYNPFLRGLHYVR